MHNNKIKKEWYNKLDILHHFPIGITTYKRRIKKLNNPIYHPFTKLVRKKLNNSNLKYTTERFIHYSILNDLFGNTRTPSIKDIRKLEKWVNNTSWDWFCNIIPSNTLPIELRNKMVYFFSQLKKEPSLSKTILFYTIEKNSEDEYYHCHFLLKTNGGETEKSKIETLLSVICEENSKRETRIYIRPYNYDIFQNRGSKYSIKELSIHFDLLK
jgi:hypothetical protein